MVDQLALDTFYLKIYKQFNCTFLKAYMPLLKAYMPSFKAKMTWFTAFFEGIYAIIWRHVSMSPEKRLGSTHSTGSLEGVTFLAVDIVDKKKWDSLTKWSALPWYLLWNSQFNKFEAPSMNIFYNVLSQQKTKKPIVFCFQSALKLLNLTNF